MSFKQIAVALSTAALTLGATAASAVQYGDENDASWVYAAPTAKKWNAQPAKDAEPRQQPERRAARVVDENGTTSFYTRIQN